MTLEVLENDDWDPSKYEDPAQGFLFYPFCLDVEPSAQVDESAYIAGVANLLTVLRSHGCKAVAACDFEDQLPPG